MNRAFIEIRDDTEFKPHAEIQLFFHGLEQRKQIVVSAQRGHDGDLLQY